MNRRDLVAAAALFPGAGWLAACAAASSAASASASAPVAPLAPFSDTEPWWRDLRRQFYIADGIFLNTGTFGASPAGIAVYPVPGDGGSVTLTLACGILECRRARIDRPAVYR